MKEIFYKDLKINPFTLIGDEWMLITAGNQDNYNTMTASWGQMGALWSHGGGSPVVTIYVRPQRYTKEFVDSNKYFTLTFFSKEYKKDLAYLGSHSGRNEDKILKTNLHPIFENDYTYFKEAKLVLICEKVYAQDILEENFINKDIISEHYQKKDFHTMYIGLIKKVLINEN